MEKNIIENFVEKYFEKEILPNLMDFIRIPNLSPSFDVNWNINGLQDKAVLFIANWVIN